MHHENEVEPGQRDDGYQPLNQHEDEQKEQRVNVIPFANILNVLADTVSASTIELLKRNQTALLQSMIEGDDEEHDIIHALQMLKTKRSESIIILNSLSQLQSQHPGEFAQEAQMWSAILEYSDANDGVIPAYIAADIRDMKDLHPNFNPFKVASILAFEKKLDEQQLPPEVKMHAIILKRTLLGMGLLQELEEGVRVYNDAAPLGLNALLGQHKLDDYKAVIQSMISQCLEVYESIPLKGNEEIQQNFAAVIRQGANELFILEQRARNARVKRKDLRFFIYTILFSLGLVGVVILIDKLILQSNNSDHDDNCVENNNLVTWRLASRWVGDLKPESFSGVDFCLQNNDVTPLLLGDWQFDSLANITATNIWGALYPYGSRFTQKMQENGYLYTISPPSANPVYIAANSELCATFQHHPRETFGPVKGFPGLPIDVWMNGNPINIQNKTICTKKAVANYRAGTWWQSYMTYYNAKTSQLPLDSINEIHFGFIGMNNNTKVNGKWQMTLIDPNGDVPQLLDLLTYQGQRTAGNLDVYLGFGGYCSGQQFNAISGNKNISQAFIDEAVNLAQLWRIKGFVADQEWWGSDTDGCNAGIIPEHYLDFHLQFCQALQAKGLSYQMAMPGGIDKIAQINSTLSTLANCVSAFQIMTYDYYGFMGGEAGDLQALRQAIDDPRVKDHYDSDSAIKAYLNAGVPSQKLLLGQALYGRAMKVPNVNSNYGRYQNIISIPLGERDGAGDTPSGAFSINCIFNSSACFNQNRLPSDLIIVDVGNLTYGNMTYGAWGYSPSQNIVLSFDSPASTIGKAQYIKEKQLGGAFSFSADTDMKGESSLVRIMARSLSAMLSHQTHKHAHHCRNHTSVAPSVVVDEKNISLSKRL